jgi:membrane-associated phospholipid phosphatase
MQAPLTPQADAQLGWVERVRRAPLHRPFRYKGAAALAGSAALATSWWVVEATSDDIPATEASVFEAINTLPEWLKYPLWPVIQVGNFWAWAIAVPVGTLVFKRAAPPLSWFSSPVLAWAVAKWVKASAERGRPGDVIDLVIVRESHLSGLGFVSGHSAVAFALATAVTPYVPPGCRWAPWTVAGGTAFARVYYGAHLPLDVVGGAGVGVLYGLVVSLAIGVPDVNAVANPVADSDETDPGPARESAR